MFPRTTRLLVLSALFVALFPPLSAEAVTVGHITGNVKNEAGENLAGIDVYAWQLSNDGVSWEGTVAAFRTNTAGNYRLDGLTSGKTFAVEFVDATGQYVAECYDNMPGATLVGPPAGVTTWTAAADQNPGSPWNAVLGTAGGITGIVSNSAGTAVSGVKVNAYRRFDDGSYASTIAAEADSGSDGRYTLRGLGGGSYALQFNRTLTPYLTHYRGASPTAAAVDIANATPVTVTVGVTVPDIDETMVRPAGLEGNVSGTGGVALGAVLVQAFRSEGGGWSEQIHSATSDGSGKYATERQLYPGTYRVRFSGAGYPAQYHQNAVLIEYAADVTISEDTSVTLDTQLLASDNTAPVSTTTPLPTGWVTDDVVASLTATDEPGGSGVGAIYWTLDTSTPTTYAGVPVTISAEGTSTFAFWAVDRFGNVETSHTATITIDSVAPITTASGSGEGVWPWRGSTATVTLSPADAGSGVASTWYSVDGVPSSGTTFSVTTEGIHPIQWGSIDVAGNREATRNATIRIDRTPPVTAGSGDTASGVFTFSPSDGGGSGVAGTWYSLDGVTWIAGTSVTLGPGTYSIRYYSLDNAGNSESPAGPVTFTVAGSTPAPPTPPPSDPPPVVAPTLPKASLTRPYARSYTVYRYRSVPVYGFLRPRHALGATSVTLQAYHYENGKWVRRATWLAKNANYSSYTKYVRSSIAFKYAGRWRVRAYHSDSRHAPSYSSWSYFTVR